jgi:N-hydroxyarylamine O-acetyltransferase
MEPMKALVLERLGLSGTIEPNEAGLRDLYRAWCYSVPFDNMRKLIAHSVGAEQQLPGTDASDFFHHWLNHGTGGTCWASSNALFALAHAVGFEVFRSTASMWDRGEATHGTVIARIDNRDWLIDSSILTVNPLPLVESTTFQQPGPLHPVEVEWDSETFVFWFEAVNHSVQFPCRLLSRHVEHQVYAARYEATRTSGPFNERLFIRRNAPGRLIMLIGNMRWERTTDRQTERVLTERELLNELTIRLGYSEEVVKRWAECGGLEAAMTPPSLQPDAPPLARLSPSLR